MKKKYAHAITVSPVAPALLSTKELVFPDTHPNDWRLVSTVGGVNGTAFFWEREIPAGGN